VTHITVLRVVCVNWLKVVDNPAHGLRGEAAFLLAQACATAKRYDVHPPKWKTYPQSAIKIEK
jgi:hypothetical protein